MPDFVIINTIRNKILGRETTANDKDGYEQKGRDSF